MLAYPQPGKGRTSVHVRSPSLTISAGPAETRGIEPLRRLPPTSRFSKPISTPALRVSEPYQGIEPCMSSLQETTVPSTHGAPPRGVEPRIAALEAPPVHPALRESQVRESNSASVLTKDTRTRYEPGVGTEGIEPSSALYKNAALTSMLRASAGRRNRTRFTRIKSPLHSHSARPASRIRESNSVGLPYRGSERPSLTSGAVAEGVEPS